MYLGQIQWITGYLLAYFDICVVRLCIKHQVRMDLGIFLQSCLKPRSKFRIHFEDEFQVLSRSIFKHHKWTDVELLVGIGYD